jgi:hypothetical protein
MKSGPSNFDQKILEKQRPIKASNPLGENISSIRELNNIILPNQTYLNKLGSNVNNVSKLIIN